MPTARVHWLHQIHKSVTDDASSGLNALKCLVPTLDLEDLVV